MIYGAAKSVAGPVVTDVLGSDGGSAQSSPGLFAGCTIIPLDELSDSEMDPVSRVSTDATVTLDDYNGTLSGPGPTGADPGAAAFDQSNYLQASDDTVFNYGASSFSFAVQVKFDVSLFNRNIFSKWSFDFGGQYFFSQLSSGLRFYVVDEGGLKSTSGPSPITLGQWLHVICEYDATANEIAIYVDGVKGTPKAVGTVSTGTDSIFTVGASSNMDRFFDGSVSMLIAKEGLFTQEEKDAFNNDWLTRSTI